GGPPHERDQGAAAVRDRGGGSAALRDCARAGARGRRGAPLPQLREPGLRARPPQPGRAPGVKALVTGAAGFIGAHVEAAPAARGAAVRAFDSQAPPPHARVDDWAKGDLLDQRALHTAVDGCDAVFHLAAVYSYYRRDAERMLHVNVEGTRNV